MPPYNTQSPPPFLGRDYPLNTFLVFSAETVLGGELSQQVQIPVGLAQKGVRAVIDFSAAPGNCEFQVMEADNDVAGQTDYNLVPAGGDMTQANLVAGPNGAGTRLWTDLIPIAGQFTAIYCKTAPANAGIKVTARLTRAA